jgi:hypothetical protein
LFLHIRPQWAPKDTQEDTKRAQKGYKVPKVNPRETQTHPKVQKDPTEDQKDPKANPKGPNTVPKGSKASLKLFKRPQSESQRAPRKDSNPAYKDPKLFPKDHTHPTRIQHATYTEPTPRNRLKTHSFYVVSQFHGVGRCRLLWGSFGLFGVHFGVLLVEFGISLARLGQLLGAHQGQVRL